MQPTHLPSSTAPSNLTSGIIYTCWNCVIYLNIWKQWSAHTRGGKFLVNHIFTANCLLEYFSEDMKIAVFGGGWREKKVQKRPWLQLESTDFLQREFFWPRVGVKVMHQWWSSPPQPLRKHWHILHTIKLLETQKPVGLKGCKRHQSQSKMNLNTAKRNPKKQSENFAQTTSIQKHTDYSNDKNKIFIPQQCHTTQVE